mgnify:CR=1 FL=1
MINCMNKVNPGRYPIQQKSQTTCKNGIEVYLLINSYLQYLTGKNRIFVGRLCEIVMDNTSGISRTYRNVTNS